jgi:tetratricopeptide (TPR) repeat protein
MTAQRHETASSRWVRSTAVARGSVAAVLVALSVSAAACSSGPSTPSGTPNQLLEKGLSAQTAGNLDLALSYYHAVLSKQPSNVEALYDIGTVYQSRHQVTQAASWFRRAINVDPKFAPALYDLGYIEAANNPSEAITLFQEAVAAQPMNASAWFNLGVLLYRQGQVTQGRADLRHAISLNASLGAQVPSDVKL